MTKISRRAASGLLAASVFTPLAPALAQSSPAAASPTSVNTINLLETEHREALALIGQILATDNGPLRQSYLQTLANLLTIHNANEENLVYPAVSLFAHRPADTELLYHEQDASKIIIAELLITTPTSATFTTLTRDLQAALEAHIHQEEAVDFPAVQAALGPNIQQLNVLSAKLRAHWNPNAY